MSGVCGSPKITREDFKFIYRNWIDMIRQEYEPFKYSLLTGSYFDETKQLFGDIDNIFLVEGDNKKQSKLDFIEWLKTIPEGILEPFENPKHLGKLWYNSGEIVSVRFQGAQIDNIFALSENEAKYKKAFLDMEAPKQGLILGLIKTILLELPVRQTLHDMAIIVAPLNENWEYEFNISPCELQLRKVHMDYVTMKTIHSEIVWRSKDWNYVLGLLKDYAIQNKSFESLLTLSGDLIKKERSRKRIIGLFQAMITIKSGEVGTPKGQRKTDTLQMIKDKFEK